MNKLTRYESEELFLQHHVYKGLQNLNTGFDVPSIYYFSADDFEEVLRRVKRLGISIEGIEPFLDGEFYDVITCFDMEDRSNKGEWYFAAFEKLKSEGLELQYAASYSVPDRLLC